MRNKIAKRKRKEMLRNGAKITYFRKVLSREELADYDLTRRENDWGWIIRFEYNNHSYVAFGRDPLNTYKLALWCMEPDKYPEPKD